MFKDLKAIFERDPAARGVSGFFEVIFLYSGFHALFFYRIAHFFRCLKIPFFPRLISQLGRFITGIEIHPFATIGEGFFIDHGMGVVIGETTVIGDNVTLFQGVTLGGTGKEKGKRHPTLKNNIVVGAGAKILGDITIGNNVKIGANSVVLRDVPDNATVVGVPGIIVKMEGRKVDMSHNDLPTPIQDKLDMLDAEIKLIENRVCCLKDRTKTCLKEVNDICPECSKDSSKK